MEEHSSKESPLVHMQSPAEMDATRISKSFSSPESKRENRVSISSDISFYRHPVQKKEFIATKSAANRISDMLGEESSKCFSARSPAL